MAFIDGTVVRCAAGAAVRPGRDDSGSSLGALLLTRGALGDLYGCPKLFATGVALLSLASVWCGLARVLWALDFDGKLVRLQMRKQSDQHWM
jgi:hypothetical protein